MRERRNALRHEKRPGGRGRQGGPASRNAPPFPARIPPPRLGTSNAPPQAPSAPPSRALRPRLGLAAQKYLLMHLEKRHKRESRLCHLEAAALQGRRARNCEATTLQERVRSQPRRATRGYSLGPPPPAPATPPLTPPAPPGSRGGSGWRLLLLPPPRFLSLEL